MTDCLTFISFTRAVLPASQYKCIAAVLVGSIVLLLLPNLAAQNKDVADDLKPYSEKKISTKKIGIGIKAGAALPLGDYKDKGFASSGLSFGSDVNYYWDKFGIGINLGQFSNPVGDKVQDELANIALPISTFYVQNRWISTYFGLGPVVKFRGKNFNAEVLLKGGMLNTKSPEFIATTGASGQQGEILNFPAEKLRSNFITAGVNLSYQISESVTIDLSLEYLTSLNAQEYTYRYVALKESNGIPGYQGVEVLELPIVEQVINVNPATIHARIGLKLLFGCKPKPEEEEEDEEVEKETGLLLPYYDVKRKEEGHFYPVTDRQLRFMFKSAYRTNDELSVYIMDYTGSIVVGNVIPINMHEVQGLQDVYTSLPAYMQYMLPLGSASLKEGRRYTMVINGLKIPYYLRFEIDTEDVED
jgi:hypothetical protein